MASVVPDLVLPSNMLGARRSSLASLVTITLSSTFARTDWTCIDLQLFALVYQSFLAFGIRIVSLIFQLVWIPLRRALFIIARKRVSLDFLNSLTSLVGIWSGPGEAPLGDTLRAASNCSRVSSASGIDSIVVLFLCRCPLYKASWSLDAI